VILFAKVESSFEITGRGCVIVPVWLTDDKIRIKDSIQLRSAEGKVRETHITGIEVLCGLNASDSRTGILVTRDVKKQDVPEGTEIWLRECEDSGKP
jgi:translation elongation factor EF-Tu-like GTPase